MVARADGKMSDRMLSQSEGYGDTMQPKYHAPVRRIALLLLLLAVALTATSCAQAWDWLWSRDYCDPMDPDDMILADGAPEEDTDVIFEGAVEYTGEDVWRYG